MKRLPLETYRLQRRGGKGITGMVTREEDAVRRLIVCDTHDNVLFFTERGRVFQSRAYDLPDAKRQAKGIPLVNVIDSEPGEQVTALVTIRDYDKDYMVMATADGEVKKTPLADFKEVRRNGKIAMDLEKGDEFIAAKLVHEDDEVVMITSNGQATRFPVSRAAVGVAHVRRRPRHQARQGRQGRLAGSRHAGPRAVQHHRERLRQAHAVRGLPGAPPRRPGRAQLRDHEEDRARSSRRAR